MKKTPPTLKEAKFLPKKLSKKNVKQEITKAIKKVAKGIGEDARYRMQVRRHPMATGLWGHAIRVETTKGTAVYPVSWDLAKWCNSRDFPTPKNEEEEKRILALFDYRLYMFKKDLRNFINDIFDILVAERAILFYLGVAIGVIIGFSVYHYFF